MLARGLLLGLAIAAPVGPIGLLCIQRTIRDGRAAGLSAGLGAATADAFYGIVAAFGLGVVSRFLVEQQRWLALFGGVFLLFLGLRTFLTPVTDMVIQDQASSRRGAYLTTLVLTLGNPATILSFVAVFAGLGLAVDGGQWTHGALLVAGVFVGSASWWLFLSTLVAFLGRRLDRRWRQFINYISGLILVGFGLAALLFSRS